MFAYLALQQGRPVQRDQLTTLFWDGYTPTSAKTSLRVALSNLRQIFAPGQLIEIGREIVQLQEAESVWWCDAIALTKLLAPDAAHPNTESLTAALRLYTGEFLAGFESIDSQPFRHWLQAQRTYYRQLIEPLRAHAVVALSLPTNIGRTLTPLIGRQVEMRRLQDLLADADYPLITVMGEGGVGKTRLALAVAQSIIDSSTSIEHRAGPSIAPELVNQQRLIEQFTDGIWFVPLADTLATDQVDEQIAATIGAALRIAFYRTAPLVAQLIDYVREKALLLILDSFEYLNGGGNFLVTLLREARHVKLLITSRQQLGLQAEYIFRLEGLPIPSESTDKKNKESASNTEYLQSLSSVKLFHERARRVAPNFRPNQHTYADIAAICRLVNGLPLAIELAATQVARYPCAEIRRKLATNYATLTTDLNDMPPRHRSLQMVLDDSWRLLTGQEAHILTQCVIFQDSFALPAAVAITGTEPQILEQLVQKLWLRINQDNRYLLHDVVRQYATAKLQIHEPEQMLAIAQRHSDYYLALLSAQEAELYGPTPQVAMALIRQELMNIQAGWRWALAHGRWQYAAQGSAPLADFYQMAGLVHTGEAEFAQAVNAVQAVLTQAAPALVSKLEWALAKFLCAQAQMLVYLGDNEAALRAAEQVVALAEPYGFSELAAFALWLMSRLATRQGQLTEARKLLMAGLTKIRPLAIPRIEISILHQLGNCAFSEANYAEAMTWYAEALASSRAHHHVAHEVRILGKLAAVAHARDNYIEASDHCETGLRLAQQIGARDLEDSLLSNLAIIWAIRGDYATAQHYFNRALNAHRQSGDRMGQANVLANLGSLLGLVGDYATAFAYTEQSLQIMQLAGFEQESGVALLNLGLQAHHMGDHRAAQRFAEQGLQNSRQLQNPAKESFAWKVLGDVLVGSGQLAEAATAYTKAVTLARTLELPYLLVEPLAGLVQMTLAQKGAPAIIMGYIEELLPLLRQESLNNMEGPFDVYLACYQGLAAYNDPRAEALLQEAYQQLQTRASLISDAAMQHSFLNKVVTHRVLTTLAVAQKVDNP